MFAPDLPTSVSWGANHHLFYSVASIYGNIGMIWGASSPCAKRMHVYPEITLNSCACSARALVAVAIWLWLTVVLTTLFMRHLLAVNQSGHPGAIDGAVGLCETCLSEPTHRSAAPPLLRHQSFSAPSLLSLRHSVACLLFLQRHGGPLIPDTITDSLGPHLSSSGPQVPVMECFTRAPAGDWGLIYMWFLLLLLKFVCAPSALTVRVTNPFSSFPLKFLLFLLLPLVCSLTLHLSTWQVTRPGPPADWLIGGLSSLSIFLQSHAGPDQDGADPSRGWTKGAQLYGRRRKTLWQNLQPGVNPVAHPLPTAFGIWILPEASACQIFN